jgi:hypothetical protein
VGVERLEIGDWGLGIVRRTYYPLFCGSWVLWFFSSRQSFSIFTRNDA